MFFIREVRKAELNVTIGGPEKLIPGEEATIEYKVTNAGNTTLTATGIGNDIATPAPPWDAAPAPEAKAPASAPAALPEKLFA